MGDTKTFTTRFVVDDLFTSKFAGIQNLIDTISNSVHKITFDVDNSAIQQTADLGNKLVETNAGIESSVQKVTDVSKKSAEAHKQVTDATKKGTDETKKHASTIDQLKDKYQNLNTTFDKFRASLAGIAALLSGGAIAGVAWTMADRTLKATEQAYGLMGRTKSLDMPAIEDFVSQASKSGYMSTTDRLSLVYMMQERGAKNAKSMISATSAVEQFWYKNQEFLEMQHGITSARDLGEIATSKIVGRSYKNMLDAFFGKGFSTKSQASRIKELSKLKIDIDINAEMAERPIEVIKTRLKSITKSIGIEMSGPMKAIAGGLTEVLGVFDRNPILTKLLAIVIGITAIGGALISVITLLPLLAKGLAAAQAGFALLTSTASIGALVAFIANPITILVALSAILLIVAYKTGVLHKAWDKFAKSAIGKDILGGLADIFASVGKLINRFEEWYKSGGKSGLLAVFFTWVELVGKIFEFIDKIYSTMRAGGAPSWLAGMAALASIPFAFEYGIISTGLKTATGKDASDWLEVLVDIGKTILRWFSTTFPFASKIHDIINKLWSLFEWFYSLFEGFVSWIKTAMPGAKKEAAREKLVGYTERVSKASDTYNIGYDKGSRSFKVYTKGGMPAPIEAGAEQSSLVEWFGSDTAEKLLALKNTYETTPGFAEDIADAIIKGLAGLGSAIATGIGTEVGNWLKEKALSIPGMDDLVSTLGTLSTALGDLKTRLDDLIGGIWGLIAKLGGKVWSDMDKLGRTIYGFVTSPFNKTGSEESTTSTEVPTTAPTTEVPAGLTLEDINPKSKYLNKKTGVTKSGADVLLRKDVSGFDISNWELEASSSQGLSLDDLLGSIDLGKEKSKEKIELHIHNKNEFDFAGCRIDSGFDIESFLRKIDSRIETVSIASVMKVLGQRRT